MGKIVETKKKKKKGRPSLLDLHKRNLKSHDAAVLPHSTKQPAIPTLNHASATSSSLRRSARRKHSVSSPETRSEDSQEKKKVKLVVKLPNTTSNSGEDENDDETTSICKKRRVDKIIDGSESEKREKSVSAANPTNDVADSLPDKKLLVFILDRLQKKDTYGAFSDPVDPDELPDYREVIEHPMDFSTVRKKLSAGAYANLEQFERDVFLICTNAMQYNAPDTIYFRQARSIQELAKKDFENLRQDNDDEQPEPKIARRGRPPTKNLKKPLGRPPLDRSGPEFSSDAAVATAGERPVFFNNDPRKGPHLAEKSGFADSSGQLHNSRSDAYGLSDYRFERIDENTGSVLRGNSMKFGKKQSVPDESRRNTYKQFDSAGWREPSVLATFDAERKHLVAVGLLVENGYARSLARFAAHMGPVAWRIASKRIETALLPGVRYGPGWVGENDIPPQRMSLLSSQPPCGPSPLQPISLPGNSSATATDSPKDSLPEKEVCTDRSSRSSLPPSVSEPAVKREPLTAAEADGGLNPHTTSNVQKDGAGVMRPRPPFQNSQNPGVRPNLSGLNGTYQFNIPGARLPVLEVHSSEMPNTIPRTNTDFVHPISANSSNAENPKPPQNSRSKRSGDASLNSSNTAQESSNVRPQPSQREVPEQPKPGPRCLDKRNQAPIHPT